MATATTNYATPKVERNALSIKRAEHRRFFLRETFCPLFDALLHKKKAGKIRNSAFQPVVTKSQDNQIGQTGEIRNFSG